MFDALFTMHKFASCCFFGIMLMIIGFFLHLNFSFFELLFSNFVTLKIWKNKYVHIMLKFNQMMIGSYHAIYYDTK